MSLYVVATPIGNPEDLTVRARRVLSESELVIVEEFREGSSLLKQLGISKPLEQLNEHSESEDLKALLELCRTKRVALISDCGTPGFCDPGAELVALCQKENIPVHSAPGASSLMTFLSICGVRLNTFNFLGFLPANKEERSRSWADIKRSQQPLIIMDTPYRLPRLIEELAQHCATQQIVLGIELSKENEQVFKGTPGQVKPALQDLKAQFMLLLLPSQNKNSTRRAPKG